jgi:hypothetical protein
MKKYKTIDEEIEESFTIWMKNADFKSEEKIKENNKKAFELFENLTQGMILEEIDYNNYMKLLNFGLEKKIEIYFNQESKLVIGKVCYDKINGGRIGLVHGGCLFYTLILCITILIEKLFVNSPSHRNKNIFPKFSNVNTKYLKTVPINLFHIVRVVIQNEELKAEILDCNSKVCAVSTYKLSDNFECVNKF